MGYPDDLTFAAGFYLMLMGFLPAMVAGAMALYGKYRYAPDEVEGDGPEDAGEGPEGDEETVDVPAYATNDNTDESEMGKEDVE